MSFKELGANLKIFWENLLIWKDQFLEAQTWIMPWKTIEGKVLTIIGIIIGLKILYKKFEKYL